MPQPLQEIWLHRNPCDAESSLLADGHNCEAFLITAIITVAIIYTIINLMIATTR
jgi:hypothetical protein